MNRLILTFDDDLPPFIDFDDGGKPAFYNYIANRFFGGRENTTKIDVCKIKVSHDIYDDWFARCTDEQKFDFNMVFLNQGPSQSDDLPPKTIIIEPGAFVVKKATPISKLLDTETT